MILTCPECSTKYLTKPEAVGANGRTVKCAKCDATWFVSADDAADATSALDKKALEEDLTGPDIIDNNVPDIEADSKVDFGSTAAEKGAHVLLRDKVDAEKLRVRRRTIALIWAIPLFLLMLAAVLAYVFRQEIVIKAPAAASLYEAFGITVKSGGLEIENPTAKTALIEGETVLVVSSAIRNISPDNQTIPMMRFTLHNRSGDYLAEWFVEPQQSRLAPKARLEFVTQYPNPPVDAVNLRYDFSKS